MRTTVTLDPDTESMVRQLMERRGVSFKQALQIAGELENEEIVRRMRTGQ